MSPRSWMAARYLNVLLDRNANQSLAARLQLKVIEQAREIASLRKRIEKLDQRCHEQGVFLRMVGHGVLSHDPEDDLPIPADLMDEEP